VDPLTTTKHSAEIFNSQHKNDGVDPAVGKTGGGVSIMDDTSGLQLTALSGAPTAHEWFDSQVKSFNNSRCMDDGFPVPHKAAMLVPKVAISKVSCEGGMIRFQTDNMVVNLTWYAWFNAIDSLRSTAERVVKNARLVVNMQVQVPRPTDHPPVVAASLGHFSKQPHQAVYASILGAVTEVLRLKGVEPRCKLESAEMHITMAVSCVLSSLEKRYKSLQALTGTFTNPFQDIEPTWKHGLLDESAYMSLFNHAGAWNWLTRTILGALVDLDHPMELTAPDEADPDLTAILFNGQPTGNNLHQLQTVRVCTGHTGAFITLY